MHREIPVLFVAVLLLAGCGPSKTELAEKERARLELEEKQRLEAERANQAITEMNKKLGRKVELMDLGLPANPPLAPAPEKSKQP